MRNYGLGDFTKYIIGRPRLVRTLKKMNQTEFECPNCRIDTVAEIQVVVEDLPMLSAKFGVGTYLSCPACPWAAPMLVHSVPEIPDWLKF